MTARIFILDGHPGPTSLSRDALERYAAAARAAGHDVRLCHLHDLDFDPDRGKAGYSKAKPLEPALEEALANLEWCTHFTLGFPMWWGAMPAKLKGWMDRVLVNGRVFTTQEKTPMGFPKPLLTGRTARVLITSDTPRFYMRLGHGDAIHRQLRGQILGFVGFKPVKISFFAPASHPTERAVNGLFAEMEKLGRAAA
ncbi:MAG: NAD(P)H-dependent oxidoreductase [Pseudomonadota bacterium]